MKDGEILKVLQRGVMAAVTASQLVTSDFPIKFVGRSFAPPDDQKWLEMVFLPNNRSDFLGDEKNYAGAIRLILHWPNDDEGAYGPLAVLASIAAYFSKGLFLQNVQICETPDLTGVLEGGSETLYPATIRYNSFHQE